MITPIGNPALNALGSDDPITIDPSRCARHRCGANPCSKCIDNCEVGAIKWDVNGLGIDTSACTGCLRCMAACPTEALTSPEFRLLQVLSELAEHPVPVLGCTGQPNSEGHAKIPCLGYLAHPELMGLCALVFEEGLHANLTVCEGCENSHIVPEVVQTYEFIGKLIPDHKIELVTEAEDLRYQSPGISRRQLFSLFKRKAVQKAARSVRKLRDEEATQPYGSKMTPSLRILLLKAVQHVSESRSTAIARALFGNIEFTSSCCGSGRCVAVCPTGAIQSRHDGRTPPDFKRYLCVSCRSCEAFCRDQGVLVIHKVSLN